MLNRVKSLFARGEADTAAAADKPDDLQLAAAALLVHAACVDSEFDEGERDAIVRLVRDGFDLSAEEAEDLVAAAATAVDQSVQLLSFTRRIKDEMEYERRVELVEMLWEVVHEDGEVCEFESQLMRRIGGLIYVTDRDRGLARQRVLARL